MGNVEENTYKTKMSDQQDIFNIRKQMSSADHEVVTVSRNIVTPVTLKKQVIRYRYCNRYILFAMDSKAKQ